MRRNALMLTLALASLPTIGTMMAQDVVSAKAGLIHESEGVVKINGEEYHQEGLRFTSMKEGDTLSTEAGRAEILLNPGAILRVGEDSAFNLVAASLTNTRLKLESGMIIVEVADLPKETSVSLDVNGQQIALNKRGLYEFQSAAPSRIRVYDGELTVAVSDGETVRLGKGRQYDLALSNTEVAKFDVDDDNSALYRWGARRARTLVAASQTLPRTSTSFTSTGLYNGAWAFNPLLGMYTYISSGGRGIYLPYANVIYIPVVYAPSGGGFSGGGGGGGGNSSFGISAAPSYVGAGAASTGSSGRATAAPSAPAVSAGGSGGRSR